MARKKQITLTFGVVGLASLLSMSLGECLPEPTDPLVVYLWDWVSLYGSRIDPFLGRVVKLWAYYFLSAIWYLFLAAIVIHFEMSEQEQKEKKAVISFVSFLGFGIVVASWLGVTQLQAPMGYQTGWGIFIGSVVAAVVLCGYIFYRLREVQVRFR